MLRSDRRTPNGQQRLRRDLISAWAPILIPLAGSVGIYVCLMTPWRSNPRMLGSGLILGSVMAGGVWLLPASWSWDVLRFALSGGMSVVGAIVLVTGRSSRTSVCGMTVTLAGMAALTLGWGSAAAFFIVVAGVLLPLGTAAALLATHIHSRRGAAECVEPAMACAMGGVLAGVLICGVRFSHDGGLDRNAAIRAEDQRGLALAGDVRRSGKTNPEQTERILARRRASSDMPMLADALSREHEATVVLVTVLVAFACSGVWLTSGRWNRDQKGRVA